MLNSFPEESWHVIQKVYSLQRRDGDADVDNRLVDVAWDGEDVTNWESIIDIYPLS